MKEYIGLLMEIFDATMGKGQYRTALQALQAIIKARQETNINFTQLEELDDVTLAGLISGAGGRIMG